MAPSVQELKARAEQVDRWSYRTNDDRCDICRFDKAVKEGIGYGAHREVAMVVGAGWRCKLWAPDRATAARQAGGAGAGEPSDKSR
jgi:hypothetical protein